MRATLLERAPAGGSAIPVTVGVGWWFGNPEGRVARRRSGGLTARRRGDLEGRIARERQDELDAGDLFALRRVPASSSR